METERKAGGLRQRRKDETRARIAVAAIELFAERGFERVSVAEVAAAAGVTEKTVFNHFATKEDLVYSGDEAFEDAMLDAVRSRAAGRSVLDAVREFFLATYGRGARDRAAVLAALLASSAALRVREREILARYADRLRDEIAAELGAGEEDLRPAVAAQALIAVHQGVIAGYRRGLLDRVPAGALDRRMLAAAGEAFDLLGEGLGGLGRQPRA